MEEIAEEDTRLRQHALQEAAPVDAEQEARHLAAVFLGDATVIGIEHLRRRAEDGHVAIQEQGRVSVQFLGPQLPMTGGQLDQFGHAVRIHARIRQPALDRGDGQLRRTQLVVAAPCFVDRIVVQHRQRHFARLFPAGAIGDITVVMQQRLHMADVVIRTRRLRIGCFQLGQLLRRKGQRQRMDIHARILP
ncbi:hypothetical protein D3C81_692310 [compost metagenome]